MKKNIQQNERNIFTINFHLINRKYIDKIFKKKHWFITSLLVEKNSYIRSLWIIIKWNKKDINYIAKWWMRMMCCKNCDNVIFCMTVDYIIYVHVFNVHQWKKPLPRHGKRLRPFLSTKLFRCSKTLSYHQQYTY